MNQRKAVLILSLSALLLLLFLPSCTSMSHYETAKKQTASYLDRHEDNLRSTFDELLSAPSVEDGQYDGHRCFVRRTDTTAYVQLDYDAQGMLGGQYWGIIYCPAGNLIDNGETLSVRDESTTGEGNNIFIRQEIKDGWYFYYDDYDGKIHVPEDIAS